MNEEYTTFINAVQEQAKSFGGQLNLKDWKYVALINPNTKEKLGWVSASWLNNCENAIFIDDLWVEKSFRNQHIATFLISVFEYLAALNGVKQIRLFASGEGNLIEFYERLGYVRETPSRTIMIKNLTKFCKDANQSKTDVIKR